MEQTANLQGTKMNIRGKKSGNKKLVKVIF
jgi:hypothetical protein